MSKFDIDKETIRDLADLLTETGLAELEWEQNGIRLRLARGGTVVTQQVAAQATASALPAATAPAATDDVAKHPGAVTSPMVGTVYTAPEPGSAPFIRIGDQVNEGQTIMIVEAMKTMNPIPAPKSGKVVQILVENAQPVEFGQVLILVE